MIEELWRSEIILMLIPTAMLAAIGVFGIVAGIRWNVRRDYEEDYDMHIMGSICIAISAIILIFSFWTAANNYHQKQDILRQVEFQVETSLQITQSTNNIIYARDIYGQNYEIEYKNDILVDYRTIPPSNDIESIEANEETLSMNIRNELIQHFHSETGDEITILFMDEERNVLYAENEDGQVYRIEYQGPEIIDYEEVSP